MVRPAVLLVTDRPGGPGLVQTALRDGADVTWVTGPAEAQAALRWRTFDCVLLDDGLAGAAVLAARDDVTTLSLSGEVPSTDRAIRAAVDVATTRAALVRSEAERHALVESLREGVVVHDATGEVVEANAAARQILGLPAGEPGWPAATREDGTPCAGDDHPATVALRTGRAVQGAVLGIEHPARGRRWIEVNAAPLRLPGAGGPYGAVVSFRDVTERRAAEAEVRLQAALLDAAGNAIVATDPDGTVRYWNSGAEAMYGWTAAAVLGRAASALPVFRGLAGRAEEVAAALRAGVPWTGDVDAIRRDGTVIRTLVTQTPLLDEGGRLVAVIAVATDVTARRQAEDAARRLSAIVDSSHDAIIGRALDGMVVSWNRGAERLTGYTAAEAIGRHSTFAAPPERLDQIADVMGRVGRGETVPPYETVVFSKAGTLVDVSLTVSPIRDDAGNVVGSSAIAKDITEQVWLRRAAEADRRRLAEAQAVAGFGSFEHVLADGHLVCSDELYRIVGLPSGTPLAGADVLAMVHPDDRDGVLARLREAAGQNAPVDVTCRFVRPDGEVRTVVSRCRAHRDDGDAVTRLVGTVLDVTDRIRADDERRKAERRFESGFAHATAGTAIAGLDGRIVRVNAALCALLGRPEEELVGHRPDEFAHAEYVGLHPQPFAAAVAGPQRTGVEIRFVRPSGEAVDALVDVAVVCGDDGAPDYLFAQLLDITRRKRAERALAHQALHDALTGLPNRVLLLDRLGHALASRDRRAGNVALLVVDLDHFKLVNDRLGHAAGDALLADTARRLSAAVRPGDTVGRLGGDEFVVCCEDIAGPEDAWEVADRVLEGFAAPFVVEGRELLVTASVGVTLSAPGVTADALLRDADAAMYRAKERGRARAELFDESFRLRAVGRLGGATALRREVRNGGLAVHYQLRRRSLAVVPPQRRPRDVAG